MQEKSIHKYVGHIEAFGTEASHTVQEESFSRLTKGLWLERSTLKKINEYYISFA